MVVIFHMRKYFFLKCFSTIFIVLSLILIYHILKYLHYVAQRTNCKTEEKIDAVYTWVNGSDPVFLRKLNEYMRSTNTSCDSSKQRFDDKYELKFSLRSLEKFAPWINHVYIVTNGQIPYWLNLDYDKVSIITHEEIFKDVANLPTFSSPAIESNLHRTTVGLSQKFIYFNDDVFLASSVYPEDFYTPGRGFLVYLAWPLSNCAPNCLWLYVNDGQCDRDCYTPECQMDGGDCTEETPEEQKLLFDTTDKFIDENKTRSIAFDETVEKVQTNLYRSFLGKLNNSNAFINQLTSNNTDDSGIKNISYIVNNHNDRLMRSNKLRRQSMRKWRFEGRRSSRDIDAYSASLQHSNRAFNSKYGYRIRKVPSHAPILVDRAIMAEMMGKFAEEFAVTEGNRARMANDMQFSFAYYHFVMSEWRNRTVEEIFDEFDTDSSDTWSDREIRTLLTQLYDLPLSYSIVDNFENALLNCPNADSDDIPVPLYERYADSKLPVISKRRIKECRYLRDLLLEKFQKVLVYKFEVLYNTEQFVSFAMLNSNISDVVGNLDEIRRLRRKFVCLNDNLDESKESENELVKAVLYDFYLSFFPKPSAFELPQELRNKFLYVDELNEWKYARSLARMCLCGVIASLILFATINALMRVCCLIVGKIRDGAEAVGLPTCKRPVGAG
ncbi:unnamed protein product [Phyllotreta striolata]|uniref:LNR domain-containing protein n=1 Tax=Phyllotreta striolata TaxID=444603 RepID=A0A9N9TJQ2_PHYSR|nr:unnamed protein product [Phyllotreta striolata]